MGGVFAGLHFAGAVGGDAGQFAFKPLHLGLGLGGFALQPVAVDGQALQHGGGDQSPLRAGA